MSIVDYEQSFISSVLNNPQPLPDIFKILHPSDFENQDYACIYHALQKSYSGLAMDTAVWLKKMFDFIINEYGTNETETRLELRGLADANDPLVNPATLARQIKKASLHREMVQAAEAWARFKLVQE